MSCSGSTTTAAVIGMRSVTEATLTASVRGFGFIRMLIMWCSGTVTPQKPSCSAACPISSIWPYMRAAGCVVSGK